MKQHVITKWLLRDFSGVTPSGRLLATYAKGKGVFDVERPGDFMARLDAHPLDVEDQLQRIEGPAARAARRLVAKVRASPPGIARLATTDEPSAESTRAAGEAGGFRITVALRAVAALNARERSALGKFMTLMFTRSPKVERTIARIGDIYYQSARQAMARAGLSPRVRAESEAAIREVSDDAAIRAISQVKRIGTFIADMSWWVVRAEPSERFVLGDTPLAAATALGHDDEFRPLLGSSSFVLAMPLHPEVALLATPTPGLPMTGDQGLVDSVNRLSWSWAEHHVIAASVEDLNIVRGQLPADAWGRVLSVPVDEAAIRVAAAGDVARVLVGSSWRPIR